MSDWQIELTPQQVRAIYLAGMARGEREATAFEWGRNADGDRFDDLREVLLFDRQSGVVAELDQDEREDWWLKFREAMGA